MSNLELWDKVSKTDPKTTKTFKGKGGFTGTAVCAQSQRKKATEIFGVFGIGWVVKHESYNVISLNKTDDHYSKLFYTAQLSFTYKEQKGTFPIASEIDVFNYSKTYKTWSMGNDIYKKVRTDALTKGLSELGFNSDIFEGKYDDSKYVKQMKEEYNGSSFVRQVEIDAISELVKKKVLTDTDKAQIKTDISKATSKEEFDIIYRNVEGI